MISQYRNPIFSEADGGGSYSSFSAAASAVNAVITDNPGYCLVEISYGSPSFITLDEDWGVPHPIHSVVFVDASTDIATALSDNPGYFWLHPEGVTGVGLTISEVYTPSWVLGKP